MNSKKMIKRRNRGFTTTELLTAMGLGSIVLGGLASFTYFTGSSLLTMVNFTELTTEGRRFLDEFGRDVRQAAEVVEIAESHLTLKKDCGVALSYYYDPVGGVLYRQQDGVDEAMLENCSKVTFSVFQRTPVEGAYEQFPVATHGTAKVVQVNWDTSQSVLDMRQTSQTTYSARVVIRNQGQL